MSPDLTGVGTIILAFVAIAGALAGIVHLSVTNAVRGAFSRLDRRLVVIETKLGIPVREVPDDVG